ncbi:hypothetical protein DENSPDRAFT_6630 [Dentipellis sp. KUC8613]|nr:hypothetical protein DENSPDRAFT_6630 [Dentipellis sp. KUC8613]
MLTRISLFSDRSALHLTSLRRPFTHSLPGKIRRSLRPFRRIVTYLAASTCARRSVNTTRDRFVHVSRGCLPLWTLGGQALIRLPLICAPAMDLRPRKGSCALRTGSPTCHGATLGDAD